MLRRETNYFKIGCHGAASANQYMSWPGADNIHIDSTCLHAWNCFECAINNSDASMSVIGCTSGSMPIAFLTECLLCPPQLNQNLL